MPFDQKIWTEFEEKVRSSFPKKYSHFDRPFEVEKGLLKLKDLLQNPSGKGIAKHAFSPFLKTAMKTPRYRYQDATSSYGLETKERPISFAAHFDALIFAYFDLVLKRKYQHHISNKGISDCVLAYRDDLNGKCNIQFAKEIFDFVRNQCVKKASHTAIGFDIKGYFDTIPHMELKRHWETVLEVPRMDYNTFAVFKAITSYSYANSISLKKHFDIERIGNGKSLFDLMSNQFPTKTRMHEMFDYLRDRQLIVKNNAFFQTRDDEHPLGLDPISIGIPQGSPISSTLSNVYLLDFDLHMHNICSQTQAIYRRYCDDILIICKSGDTKFLHDRLCKQIGFHGLKIQEKKTEIVKFRRIAKKLVAFDGSDKALIGARKNLQYLGFEFDGERVYIRPGSLSRYFRKMKAGIRNTLLKAYGKKSTNPQILIKDLLEKYSHTGKNNFVSYAYRAAGKSYGYGDGYKDGFDSPTIRKQLRRHFAILTNELKKENAQRYAIKTKEFYRNMAQGKKVKSLIKKSSRLEKAS